MTKQKIKHHCWICEKAGVKVSDGMHDYVLEQIKVLSRYWIALESFMFFLVGETAGRNLLNRYAQSHCNGDPRGAALETLRLCGGRNVPLA